MINSMNNNRIFILFFLLLTLGFTLRLSREVYKNQKPENIDSHHFLKNDSVSYISISKHFFDGKILDNKNKLEIEKTKHFGVDAPLLSKEFIFTNPHRLPLYPFLLAISHQLFGKTVFSLGIVNLFVYFISSFVIFFGTYSVFKSKFIGLVTSVCYLLNHLIWSSISSAFLTEPLFLLFTISSSFLFLDFIKTQKDSRLYILSFLLGLSYLTRPNGLICFVSFYLVIFIFHFFSYKKFFFKKHIYLLLVFIITSSPTTIPRVKYFNNPFYHGYLSNFMWADTYDEASVGGAPKFSLGSYLKTHSIKDIFVRLKQGHINVYLKSLEQYKDTWRYFYFFGALILFFKRNCYEKLIILLMYIQLIPILWSNYANPTMRIPVTAILPFCLIYLCYFTGIFYDGLKLNSKKFFNFSFKN